MKTSICHIITLCFCLYCLGTSHGETKIPEIAPSIPQENLLAVIPNETYGIDCFLYGDLILGYDVNGNLDVKEYAIDDILLYERASGDSTWYEPLLRDPQISLIHFNEFVWSPNDEYFVLAMSGVAGFDILHASDVLEQLNHKETGFVRVFLSGESLKTYDLDYWHTFRKWMGNDAFLFSASHAHDEYAYIYEISSHTLSALGPFAEGDALTEYRPIPVAVKKHFTVLDDYNIAQLAVGMTQDNLLRYGEPVSPHHLPLWIYPSREGYYHYIVYFWPTKDIESPLAVDEHELRLIAITKLTLEKRWDALKTSKSLPITQEYYVFPEQMRGKPFTGLKKLYIREFQEYDHQRSFDCP